MSVGEKEKTVTAAAVMKTTHVLSIQVNKCLLEIHENHIP